MNRTNYLHHTNNKNVFKVVRQWWTLHKQNIIGFPLSLSSLFTWHMECITLYAVLLTVSDTDSRVVTCRCYMTGGPGEMSQFQHGCRSQIPTAPERVYCTEEQTSWQVGRENTGGARHSRPQEGWFMWSTGNMWCLMNNRFVSTINVVPFLNI